MTDLQEQGFRFILRRKDGRVEGYWEDPALRKPGGLDATDMEDDVLETAIHSLQMERDELDIGPDARREVLPFLRPAIK